MMVLLVVVLPVAVSQVVLLHTCVKTKYDQTTERVAATLTLVASLLKLPYLLSTMAESSKHHSNPKRHAQLVSSSSRLHQSRSKQRLNSRASFSTDKVPGSEAKTQTTTVLYDGKLNDAADTGHKSLKASTPAKSRS